MTGKFAHAYCAFCNEYSYCVPLHGDRGGPLSCLPCSGKWDAEHAPRRRARRVVIKALKAYEASGGHLYGKDFEELRVVATGFFSGNATAADFSDLTLELLTAILKLTHPDKHPPERKAEAQRVTQELLALKPFVFPAPEPEPPSKPDASSKRPCAHFNEPSRPAKPAYPCEDCVDTVPAEYCDACKAQWKKEQENERERDEQKRIQKNARQRQRYNWRKKLRSCQSKPTICAMCGEPFKLKRSDAQYCSAACRQRAYVKRDGKASNARPLGREQIERRSRTFSRPIPTMHSPLMICATTSIRD
jgi:hypothetical protein